MPLAHICNHCALALTLRARALAPPRTCTSIHHPPDTPTHSPPVPRGLTRRGGRGGILCYPPASSHTHTRTHCSPNLQTHVTRPHRTPLLSHRAHSPNLTATHCRQRSSSTGCGWLLRRAGRERADRQPRLQQQIPWRAANELACTCRLGRSWAMQWPIQAEIHVSTIACD